jgi:hypothetical protein
MESKGGSIDNFLVSENDYFRADGIMWGERARYFNDSREILFFGYTYN